MAAKTPKISPTNAAKILGGVHYTTVIRWVNFGHPTAKTRIAYDQMPNGQYVLDRASVEALAKELNVIKNLNRKRREAASA